MINGAPHKNVGVDHGSLVGIRKRTTQNAACNLCPRIVLLAAGSVVFAKTLLGQFPGISAGSNSECSEISPKPMHSDGRNALCFDWHIGRVDNRGNVRGPIERGAMPQRPACFSSGENLDPSDD